MKYCEKCGKEFEKGYFCPYCGSKLIEKETIKYDIFGEAVNEPKKDSQPVLTAPDPRQNRIKIGEIGEILSFITIGASLVPFVGFLLCIASLLINLVALKNNKKSLKYVILSAIFLVFNILWTYLLYKNGVISLTFTT